MKTISLLTETDFDTAYQIECASHTYPWSRKTFEQNQGPLYLNYKLQCNDKMAGFIISQWVADEATIFNLAIAPTYQQQGLGKQLLEHTLDIFQQRHIQSVWLEVRCSNQPAIALYHKLGFNEITIRHAYYPTSNGRE